MLTILMYALHAEPNGYIGGGWIRVIELLKRAKSHNVKFVLIETQPTFKSVYKLNYETLEIPGFLNKFFIGRVIRCLTATIYGVLRAKNGDIDLILSPVELPECVLPAYLTSRIAKLPWTSEIHLIPLYAAFWRNEECIGKTSSFRDLLREHQRRKASMLFSIFASLTQWLVFRAFRRGIMLAPSKSVVEDMQYVDKDITVKHFYPGNGVAIERINNTESKPKRYEAIYVGVLSEKKGALDAIHAWHNVVKERPNSILAIVGRGSENEITRIQKMVKQFNMESNVQFPFDLRTGAPTLEDVWRCIKQSKMLIHPSVSDTWPQVIGEALACGVPVVTYDLRPQRYAFGDCPAVFRVPAKNLDAFSSKVLEILKGFSGMDSNLAVEFAKRYSWDAVLDAEKRAFIEVKKAIKI